MDINDIPDNSKKSPVIIVGLGDQHTRDLILARLAIENDGHEIVMMGGNHFDKSNENDNDFHIVEELSGIKHTNPIILGTIGHVDHGKTTLTSAIEKVIYQENVHFTQSMKNSYLDTMENHYSMPMFEKVEEDYFEDPLRKKWRKGNNAQHPNNSKKKKKNAKQARKKNRKK